MKYDAPEIGEKLLLQKKEKCVKCGNDIFAPLQLNFNYPISKCTKCGLVASAAVEDWFPVKRERNGEIIFIVASC